MALPVKEMGSGLLVAWQRRRSANSDVATSETLARLAVQINKKPEPASSCLSETTPD
ncbi:MAG: hypothetical protein HQ518_02250 [Rhodopirellula sp.]|nr:hypothetical protein [Rhodopirellula sp.]